MLPYQSAPRNQNDLQTRLKNLEGWRNHFIQIAQAKIQQAFTKQLKSILTPQIDNQIKKQETQLSQSQQKQTARQPNLKPSTQKRSASRDLLRRSILHQEDDSGSLFPSLSTIAGSSTPNGSLRSPSFLNSEESPQLPPPPGYKPITRDQLHPVMPANRSQLPIGVSDSSLVRRPEEERRKQEAQRNKLREWYSQYRQWMDTYGNAGRTPAWWSNLPRRPGQNADSLEWWERNYASPFQQY